jgi:surface protein
MRSLTTKYYIITLILLLSIPISTQDSLPAIDPQITESVDLSTSGKFELQEITSTSFVSRWDTTKAGVTSSYQIRLPLYDGGTYDFTIDWGDGNITTISSYTQTDHTYATEGEYTVVIDGNFSGWRFNGGDRLKIIEISQWGNMNLGNTGYYFDGSENLVLTATDAPDLTGTTNMLFAFGSCGNLGSAGSMNTWNVSSVTDMSWMFYYATSFNQPLNNWDLTSGPIMYRMFLGAYSFNQPLGNWDVSSITNMNYMFHSARSFNQPLNNWDVSSVIEMERMFLRATSFNQPLGSWNVSSVTDMYHMFEDVTLSPQNYDDLLIGWSELTLQNGVIFDAGNSKYTSNAATARQYIIDTYGWNIVDGGFTSLTYPDVSSPDDYSYEQGTTGNLIEWIVGDKNPEIYNVTLDGIRYTEDNWTNGTISLNIDDLVAGVYEFIIYVYDADGSMALDIVIVTVVDTTPSDISNPNDFNYNLDATGNQIIWTVGDENPGVYNITLDGILFTTDVWTDGTITLDIDGLILGVYEFVIFVYDTYGNMASDAVVVTVNENLSTDISNPDDLSYKFGTTGNLIEWAVGDVNPGMYNITVDGNLYEQDKWSNGTISVDIDGFAVGVHEFIIFVYDLYGNMASDKVIVTVTEIDPPEISSPDNISYEQGTAGNIVEWTVGDVNPTTYEIKLDGILYEQDNWTNGTISLNVDDLLLGVYIVSLYIYDIHGNWDFDSVLVIVNEPSNPEPPVTENTTPDISNPDNISYKLNTTGNLLEWTVGDANPGIYNITLDGILYEQGAWSNGTISLVIDGLAVGLYIITLYIFDIHGNWAFDAVLVVVSEPLVTETVTDTITEPGSTVTTTVTELPTEIPTDITDTSDTPICFTFVILGLVVFVLRRRQ